MMRAGWWAGATRHGPPDSPKNGNTSACSQGWGGGCWHSGDGSTTSTSAPLGPRSSGGCSIQSLAGLAPPPVPTGSLDWLTSAGPLRSVWILRSSWTPATSPPLLRRTRSFQTARRWSAAWHWRTSPNSCLRCPPHSHGVDGPLSLRRLLAVPHIGDAAAEGAPPASSELG